ncbi:MAG: sulfite exporter TauE/SafE family protein [Phycisphaerales bacterium]|nr:MAG: sulfite exporter TauE/SafE family protein [Phycisphaerales bacterium]
MQELISLLVLGLAAGILGGMLGIGGSIVMIPVLTLLLGKNQQLSQAAAMIVNVFVAAPAVIRHHRARAVRWDVWKRMIPLGFVFIVLGVEASNRISHKGLELLFGAFLIYVIIVNIRKLYDGDKSESDESSRTGWAASSGVGAAMGFVAGLLGVGGGIVAVPLLQRICRLPLRQCIATSAAVMCITSIIGAARKNMVLEQLAENGESLGLQVTDSLIIAACLIPTAIIGGFIGAGLTHGLPLRWIRLAFILLMAAASGKFLGLW